MQVHDVRFIPHKACVFEHNRAHLHFLALRNLLLVIMQFHQLEDSSFHHSSAPAMQIRGPNFVIAHQLGVIEGSVPIAQLIPLVDFAHAIVAFLKALLPELVTVEEQS